MATTPVAIGTARANSCPHFHRGQHGTQHKRENAEHGPDEEVTHAHERGQQTETRVAGRRNNAAITPQHWNQRRQHHGHHHHDPHAKERRRVPGHVCPGIRIHVIDIVQPPGIGIPLIADIDTLQTIVIAALAAKSNADTPKKVRWEATATIYFAQPRSS